MRNINHNSTETMTDRPLVLTRDIRTKNPTRVLSMGEI